MAGAARGGSAERLRGPKPVAGGGRHPRHPQPRVVGTSGDRARPPQKPSGVRAAQPLQASPQPAGAKNPSSRELFILEPTDGPAQSPGIALTHRQTPCHEPQHRHHNKNHPISTPPRGTVQLAGTPVPGGFLSGAAPRSPGDAAGLEAGHTLRPVGCGEEEEGGKQQRERGGRKSHSALPPPPSPALSPLQREPRGAIRLPSLRSRLITARPPALLANQGR